MHELFMVLLAVFLHCKLTGAINWNWAWVLSPLWIELLIIIFVSRHTVYIDGDEEDEGEEEKEGWWL